MIKLVGLATEHPLMAPTSLRPYKPRKCLENGPLGTETGSNLVKTTLS